MRKIIEEKAITLIALIITIVVLLILAVVAINAVTGDGIIQHATNAKTSYENAQAEEKDILSYYESYLDSEGKIDTWDGKSKEEPIVKKDKNWYIYNCEQMKFFADFVNGKLTSDEKGELTIEETTTVYLMTNLDLGARHENGLRTSGTKWEPIGTSSTQSFDGIFEGNNHFIKGVYVDDEDGFAGIFGYSKNIIKNLTIKDSYIEADGTCVAGIVGRGEKLINCHNINTIVKQNSSYKVAGIVGQALSAENCTNTGTIIGNGIKASGNTTDVTYYDSSVAGIVGVLVYDGYVKNCKNSGTITGIGERVAGIVATRNMAITTNGNLEEIGIQGCVNTGNISGKGIVGGIVGVVACGDDNNNYLNFSNNYNTGKIKGEDSIGGIIGILDGIGGQIKGCYNIGTIEGNSNIGAIIGICDDGITANNIEKCYYLGAINATDGEMTEDKMRTKELVELLNAATNTEAWVGQDGQYPRLKWEQ